MTAGQIGLTAISDIVAALVLLIQTEVFDQDDVIIDSESGQNVPPISSCGKNSRPK
jgi:hypothetical protein